MLPEVVIESTDAGCASTLFSLTSDAAATCGHHESGIQACAGGQKWRQTFVQRRIHQPLQPALGDARQRAQGNAQEIQNESQRLAVEIAAGDDVGLRLAERRSAAEVSPPLRGHLSEIPADYPPPS